MLIGQNKAEAQQYGVNGAADDRDPLSEVPVASRTDPWPGQSRTTFTTSQLGTTALGIVQGSSVLHLTSLILYQYFFQVYINIYRDFVGFRFRCMAYYGDTV